MQHAWILVSVFAALCQSVRTAAQKRLNARMSTMGTTYVRSLFGLPPILAFLAAVLWFKGGGLPRPAASFPFHAVMAAATQVLATALLILLLKMRNFAVGTVLTKCDVVIAALIGTALFSERLTAGGWVSLAVVMAGVVLLTLGRMSAVSASGGETVLAMLLSRSTAVALACATLFALSFLFVRESVLTVGEGPALWRAGWAIVVVVLLQIVGLGAWLAWKEPTVFAELWPNRRIAGFIGLTSAGGSLGWFIAFGLQNASYVRAVGQVEVVFTILISWLYFRERISALEYAGIAVTVLGVLMFRLIG